MSAEDESKTQHFEENPAHDEDDNKILRYTYNCRQEAWEAKRNRMYSNRRNFDTFNLRADMSHKKKGQSQEFLPKQRMAVQQLVSFISQSIIEAGEFFSVEVKEGIENPAITAHEIKKLVMWGIEKNDFPSFIDDSLKLGVLGSLMTCKVHGQWKDAHDYEVKDETNARGQITRALFKNSKKVWEPKLSFTRQEDYFPDPTGGELFKIHQMEQDLHIIKKKSEGDNAVYDPVAVEMIVGGFEDLEQEARKARETNQLMTFHTSRKRVRIWECYGTILDPTTGDIIMENAMWTVCNDRFLIQKPIPNPFWHGEVPEVTAPLLRVPNSVWHAAMADSMSDLNIAMNELFNLQLDSGIMATWGIRQMRPNWMADDTKYADGVPPGETIEVNEACPPGGKVLEVVQTSELSPESIQVYNQLGSEFQQSAMTNDLRMGTMPNRDVKATEVVEANQSIGSMIGGIAKTVENDYLMKVLKQLWMIICQHLKDIDEDELESILGKDRKDQILALGPEALFAATVKGTKFKVFGISEAMSKMKDFRKLTSLLQTIGSSEVLVEEFIKKYDFGKLLKKIMRSLDIDTDEISHSPEEQQAMAQQQTMGAGASTPGQNPNMQSQIPQAASANSATPGQGIAQPAALRNAGQYAGATNHMAGQGG